MGRLIKTSRDGDIRLPVARMTLDKVAHDRAKG